MLHEETNEWLLAHTSRELFSSYKITKCWKITSIFLT